MYVCPYVYVLVSSMIKLIHMIDVNGTLKVTQGQRQNVKIKHAICDKLWRNLYLRGVNVLVCSAFVSVDSVCANAESKGLCIWVLIDPYQILDLYPRRILSHWHKMLTFYLKSWMCVYCNLQNFLNPFTLQRRWHSNTLINVNDCKQANAFTKMFLNR